MPRLRYEARSVSYDAEARIFFTPVLDRRTGRKVAVAEVSEEQAAQYAGRPGFTILSEEEWRAMTAVPEESR